MIEFAAILAGGLLGSAHCLGMCGGFAAAIGSADVPLGPIFGRQILYTLGRITTYAFLGACAGFAGMYLSQYRSSFVTLQQVFAWIAGLIMLYVGAGTLGLLPGRKTGGGLPLLLAPLFSHFLNGRGAFGWYSAGLATGFLPCGLVYSFLALAAAASDVARGACMMIAFGLGTAPAMIAIGCGANLLSRTARLRVIRVAACLVLVMGGVTIYRAIPSTDGACCHDPTVRPPDAAG